MPHTSRQRIGDLVVRALSGSKITFLYQTLDFRTLWVENPPEGWDQIDLVGKTDVEIFGAEAAGRLAVTRQQVIERRERQNIELKASRHGVERWFDVQIEPDIRDDAVVGMISAAIEISDEKRREIVLKSLLREVSHRSKNLLAIILSIASQTARSSGDKKDFITKFVGRLRSLARSQDVITDHNWRGASLFELIDQQLFQLYKNVDGRVEIDGDDIDLVPNASLHIGLALHELATNSATFGALSQPDGKVHISIEKDASDNDGAQLVWEETGGPQVSERPDKQFGTTTLERIVPASLNGVGRLDFSPSGARYELRFGRDNMQGADRAAQSR